jgi:AAA15 family ATPase/GTPase
VQVDLTIKNYKCFADSDPVTIPLRKGFSGLVGVNNSGKSSLLRFFFEFRQLFSQLSNPDNNFISVFNRNPGGFNLSNNVLDQSEVFCNANDRELEMQFHFNPESSDSEQRRFRLVIAVARPSPNFQMQFFIENHLFTGAVNPAERTISGGANVSVNISFLFDFFGALTNTLYIGPFRNAVNLGSNERYFDMPIGQAFIANWRSSKTGPTKKLHEAILKLTEDIRRIFNFRQLEINAMDNNQTMQLFVDGKSYFLPELGSGLSHFIMVLGTAAFRRPSYILIDEPEMGLHPSLQLDFLTTLGSYATEGVIFSTHNMGLAKGAAERVYSVRRKEDGTSQFRQLEATSRLAEFLGELSFSGYQELGFDKILLVEGATDVRTFQQFLRKYGLDHKVVLVPLGGNQLINGSRELELEEIKRISQNLFAVIDSERSSPGEDLKKDRSAFVESCKKLKIKCLVLERRAIENYLTERAIKLVKGSTFRALGPYELLRDVLPSWSKEENWRIATQMTKDELESTELGGFLGAL